MKQLKALFRESLITEYFAMLDMLREFTAEQKDVQVIRAKAGAL